MLTVIRAKLGGQSNRTVTSKSTHQMVTVHKRRPANPAHLRKRFILNKKLALTAAAAVAATAFIPGTAQAVVGGAPVQNDYKFVASLQFKKDAIGAKQNSHSCGLALISQEWGVLPASCVTKFPGDTRSYDDPSAYLVRFGASSVSGGATRYVTKFVTHPGWKDYVSGQDDIALVKLDRPTSLRDDQMAKIAEPDPTRGAVQVGWGRTSIDEKESPNILQQADVHLLPDTDARCVVRNFQGDQVSMPENHAYTCQVADPATDGGVTCYGDSGSPAIQFDAARKPVLISVNSQGGCKRDSAIPDIGTNLSHYQDWITSVISAN